MSVMSLDEFMQAPAPSQSKVMPLDEFMQGGLDNTSQPSPTSLNYPDAQSMTSQPWGGGMDNLASTGPQYEQYIPPGPPQLDAGAYQRQADAEGAARQAELDHYNQTVRPWMDQIPQVTSGTPEEQNAQAVAQRAYLQQHPMNQQDMARAAQLIGGSGPLQETIQRKIMSGGPIKGDFTTSVGQGWANAQAGLANTGAGLLRGGAVNLPQDMANQAAQGLNDYADKQQFNAIQPEGKLNQVAMAAPGLIPGGVGMAAAAVNPVLGAAVFGAQGFGSAYDAARRTLIANGHNPDDYKGRLLAGAVAQGTIDALAGSAMGGEGPMGMAKAGLGMGAMEAGRQGVQSAVTGTKSEGDASDVLMQTAAGVFMHLTGQAAGMAYKKLRGSRNFETGQQHGPEEAPQPPPQLSQEDYTAIQPPSEPYRQVQEHPLDKFIDMPVSGIRPGEVGDYPLEQNPEYLDRLTFKELQGIAKEKGIALKRIGLSKTKLIAFILGDQNAIQEPSPGEVLQRQPEQVGGAGSERPGMEPGQSGIALAPEAPPQGPHPAEQIQATTDEPLISQEEKAALNAPLEAPQSDFQALAEPKAAPEAKTPEKPVIGPLEGGPAPTVRYAEAVFRADKAPTEPPPGLGILGAARDKIASTAYHLRDAALRFSGKIAPTVTRLAKSSGEALSRFIAARSYAREASPVIAREVLAPDGGKIDPKLDSRAGALLVEDNLRHIQEGFNKELADVKAKIQEAVAKGEDTAGLQKEELRLFNAAQDVGSIIGAESSPYQTEAEYQAAHADPELKKVVGRYKQWFEDEPQEAYRVSQGKAPEDELPTRGLQTGARVNLIAIKPGEASKNPVYTSPRGNPTNPIKKKSPFARKAKGTGQAYEISLERMIQNTLGKGTEIANEHRMYNQLVTDGLAVYGKPGDHPKIGGKATIRIDTKRSVLITKKGGIPKNESLFVRADAYPEVRQALNIDSPRYNDVLQLATGLANKSALLSFKELTFHLGNQISTIIRTPGLNPFNVFKRAYDVMAGDLQSQRQLANLAKIGALPEPRENISLMGKYNPLTWGGKMINFTDRAIRLAIDDTFTKLSRDGGPAENTETNRRDFINQLGQYNKRGQSRIIALARDLGLGPFATAGSNFYSLGLKNLTLSPGLTATSRGAALKLRAMVLARFAGAIGTVALYNYFKWGRVDGGNNVPFGAMRLPNDKDGNTQIFDVLSLLNITRGLRATGARAVIEGMRKGQTAGEITDAAVRDALSAGTSPFIGPAFSAGLVMATGKNAAGYQKADIAAPGESQAFKNIKAGVQEAVPAFDVAVKAGQKGIRAALQGQGGKFEIRSVGKEESQAKILSDQFLKAQGSAEPQTVEQKARHEARHQAIKAIRDNPNYEIPEDANIPANEIKGVYTEAVLPAVAANVKHMNNMQQVMRIWRAEMSADERKAVQEVIIKKLENPRLLISPAKREEYMLEITNESDRAGR